MTAARRQAAIAVGDDEPVAIVNATTDFAAQINATRALWPATGRRTPVHTILLTDAQLDHVAGLLELRQTDHATVVAVAPALASVRDTLGFGRTLAPYVAIDWVEVALGEPFALDADLSVRPIPAAGRPPRYADAAAGGSWSVAFELASVSGATCLYAPTVGAPSPELVDALRTADAILFDGTFWSDAEPVEAGIGRRHGREFGHMPIAGPEGSLELLASSTARYRAYTHLNNSNPLLDPRSAERRELSAARIRVAEDGEEIEV